MSNDEPRRISITPPPYPKTTPGFCETGNPMCQQPARLYAAGWRCSDHLPTSRKYDDDIAA
ncbi:hypothetical protein ABT034_33715 [Streptomyces sp. NPDC002773]|uniref:hypothetical protein n=1 Tax=Streptomyces sp. NPDC002773 TaxID=3154430 RepID=UPI00332E578D